MNLKETRKFLLDINKQHYKMGKLFCEKYGFAPEYSWWIGDSVKEIMRTVFSIEDGAYFFYDDEMYTALYFDIPRSVLLNWYEDCREGDGIKIEGKDELVKVNLKNYFRLYNQNGTK